MGTPQGDSQSLFDLETIRSRIQDAAQDTKVWLQAGPSAEERGHVLAMQERLADLARIIERRRERRRSPEDERIWHETVGEVLSRLDKAKEVRGHIVGKGLGRLAGHLPRELPGSHVRFVTKAPPPITPLSGAGAWAGNRARPTQMPQNPPTNFPSSLWPKTVVILARTVREYPSQIQTLELCKRVISEMTPLFREAVKLGKMKGHDVFTDGLGGMADLLHSLLVYNDDGPHSGFSSLSDQAYRLGQEIRKSDEWLGLAEEIAEMSGEPIASNSERKASNAMAGNTRKAFLKPLLKTNGFSIHGWARAAKVDFHTANDYLNGKTKPNPDTRKQLADALGVKVETLPE